MEPTEYRCPFKAVQNTVEMLLSIGSENETCVTITFLPVPIRYPFPWAGRELLIGPV